MSAASAPTLDHAVGKAGRFQAICNWFLQPQVIFRVVMYLTTILYVRTIFFDYVYDDTLLLLLNPAMESWKSVPGFFTHTFWAFLDIPRIIDYYRPLVMVVLATAYHLLGPAPGWLHLLAAGLHILAAYLVYRLASVTTENKTLAAVAAGIFSLHPTRVETAAWISGISDSLSAVFFLVSMIAYFESKKKDAGIRRAISAGFLLLALFSKEAAIFAPLLIAIYEFSAAKSGFTDRCKTMARSVWPYAAVTCIALATRIILLRNSPEHAWNKIPFWKTILVTPQAVLWYLGKQLWPVELSIHYPFRVVSHCSFGGFVLPLFVTLTIFGLVLWHVRRSPIGIFYTSWFVVMLAPAILYHDTLQEHDRYFYFASVAASMGMAFLIVQIRRWGLLPQALTVVALFGSMAILTFNYESYWDNDLKLFTRASHIAPNNPNVGEYLTSVYVGSHDFAKAEAVANTMISNPELSDQGWRLLGTVKAMEGNFEEARTAMQRSVQLTHGNSLLANVGLATIDLKLGNNGEAATIYQRELKTYPQAAFLHEGLAVALTRLGRTDEAKRELALQKRLQ